MSRSTWQQYLAEHRERFLEELKDFLRIPSVSALPEHAGDVVRAAEWVAARLGAAGLEGVEVLPTGGHPVVYGHWLGAPGRPTVVIYGHFDVQPAEPLELWTSRPFEPEVRGDRLYARGATDDKGNMLIPILAVEALLQTEGKLPVNVKFLLEGQEEIGSPQLPDFLHREKERFAADLVLSADGMQWAEDQPCLVIGLKGLTALQIDVHGPSSDLHSGLHGGGVQNPVHALVRILDSLRAPDGRIRVAGFYDDVRPLSEEDRAQIAAVPFDEAVYKAGLGIDEVFGEPGYTTPERTGARPTLELNGIWGGFQGEGSKTIVPSHAHAKITCRLVADQDPELVAAAITRHVEQHTPPGVRVTVSRLAGDADPYFVPPDHPGNAIAHQVLEGLYDKPPYYVRMGGSIPVCPLLLGELGLYTVNYGFGLMDEGLHAPNEFFRLTSFDRGQEAYCRMLFALEDLP